MATAALFAAACQPLPTPPPPTATPLPAATVTATPPPAPAATATAAPEPAANPTRLTRPTSTPFPLPADDEDDCWGACKALRDAPPNIPVGRAQPSSHAGRDTCLVCHKDLADPVLPGDHMGRMDPACVPCHEPAAARAAATPAR